MISRNYFKEYKKVLLVGITGVLALLGYSAVHSPVTADAIYEVQVKSEASGLFYGSRLAGFSIYVHVTGKTGTVGYNPGWTVSEKNNIEAYGKLLNKWRRNEGAWEKTNFYVQSNVGNFSNFYSNNSTHGGFDNWGGANQTSFKTKF